MSAKSIVHLQVKVLICLLFFVLLVASPQVQSIPSGVGEVANDGCLCHGAKSSQSSIIIDGIEQNWIANKTYNMSIIINSSIEVSADEGARLGGFRLLVSAGVIAFEDENSAQLIEGGYTHTSLGNQYRSWNFSWTAPSSNDSVVDFVVHGNAVDSNQQSSGDAWNYYSISLAGEGYDGELGDGPEFSDEIDNSQIALLIFAVITLLGLFYYSTK